MYDDDDNNEFDDNGSDNGIAQLRAANKAQAKQVKELIARLETADRSVTDLTVKVNARTVADLLQKKGVDPGVSKFLTNVEPTEESIVSWLADNGKLIGYDPTKGSDEETSEVTPAVTNTPVSPEMAALQAAMAEVQRHEASAAPGVTTNRSMEGITRLGENAKSFEDVVKGLKDLNVVK